MRTNIQQTFRLAALGCALTGMLFGLAGAEETAPVTKESNASSNRGRSDLSLIHLPYSEFHIPFSIDQTGNAPAAVNLYVSTDGGTTWQHHGKAKPDARHFEFQAASEGEYWFTVQTVDSAGIAFPSPNPPLRVSIDTTKPQAALRAALDLSGNLIVDLQVFDKSLDAKTAVLRVRTDRESRWREIPVEQLNPVGEHFEGQVELILPPCREVLMIFNVMDLAKNNAEVTHRYTMPRTAAGDSDLQLASSRNAIPDVPGAVAWEPEATPKTFSQPNLAAIASHKMSRVAEEIETPLPEPLPEPLPKPNAASANFPPTNPRPSDDRQPGPFDSNDLKLQDSLHAEVPPVGLPQPPAHQTPTPKGPHPTRPVDAYQATAQNPYYSKSRAFSLDYSLDLFNDHALSNVELWGTEDGGSTWQKWGTDPDKTSPFDVKVGNDGTFGFRTVVVGRDGNVLGQPKSGDQADVWICVDTETPSCRITRAVFGVGAETGMLLIDYSCIDSQLADQSITMHYSSSPDGPWTTFASGLENAGTHRWKVEPNIPNHVYLKMDAVDKAGNVGIHRLDLPIDMRGLSPRGRIQGFRPIFEE